MGSKKQTTTTNSTQQNQAWAPTQPYLQSGVSGIGDWMTGAGAQSYQGPRVADLSDVTRQGVDRLTASTGANRASNYYNDVLGGKWLDQSNPYMERLQDAVRSSVMPNVNSMFSQNGLVGSTAHQGVMSRELGRAMAEPLFNAYENERSRMDGAAGALPGVDQIINGNYLQAGNILDSHAQNLVNAQQQQFEADRMAPIRGIMEGLPIINQIGSQYGTTNTNGKSTTSQSTPLGQQILGGAMMAGSLLGAPMTGGASLGMLGQGMGNMLQGAPWSYGSSWDPMVQRA